MAVATGKVGRGNLLAGFQHGDAHAGFSQLLGSEAARGPRADYDGVENVTVTVDDLQHPSYSNFKSVTGRVLDRDAHTHSVAAGAVGLSPNP